MEPNSPHTVRPLNPPHLPPTDGDGDGGMLPSPDAVLNDPAASYWLKDALRSALARDPLDAARDAELLAVVLAERESEVLAQGGVS